MSSLKYTPLHRLHQQLGAKMLSFAAYEMPLNYGTGIINEHLHCRQKVGLFDISHMGQCSVDGDNVIDELEKLIPTDLSKLNVGQQCYTVLTNDKGGILDDIIITRTEKGVSITVNAAAKDEIFSYLSHHLSNCEQFKVLAKQGLLALQGPLAVDVIAELCPQALHLSFMHAIVTQIDDMDCMISRCGYTGEDGFEISIAADQAESLARRLLSFKHIAAIGLGARDTLRLEAGLCLYGHELNQNVTPVEAGLQWLIRTPVSGFPGADIIQAQLENGPVKHRIALLIDGKIPVRQNCKLFNSQDIEIGYISSGSFSPCLNQPIAMAYINDNVDDHGLYVIVRNHQIPVRITGLPFIAHRYWSL